MIKLYRFLKAISTLDLRCLQLSQAAMIGFLFGGSDGGGGRGGDVGRVGFVFFGRSSGSFRELVSILIDCHECFRVRFNQDKYNQFTIELCNITADEEQMPIPRSFPLYSLSYLAMTSSDHHRTIIALI